MARQARARQLEKEANEQFERELQPDDGSASASEEEAYDEEFEKKMHQARAQPPASPFFLVRGGRRLAGRCTSPRDIVGQ